MCGKKCCIFYNRLADFGGFCCNFYNTFDAISCAISKKMRQFGGKVV